MTGDAEPPVPRERLDAGVRTLWRIQLAVGTLGAWVAGAMASGPLDGVLATLAWGVPVGGGALAVAVLPGLRYRRWRFEVREEEIDLRHGGLKVVRTLVPMRRVQHVDSSSGLLEQVLTLATVTVHTAGGAVSIPGLSASRSRELHRRIATLARLDDD